MCQEGAARVGASRHRLCTGVANATSRGRLPGVEANSKNRWEVVGKR